MKIAIASINDALASELGRRLNTELVFTSLHTTVEKKRADISIQLDQEIFLHDLAVDFVVEIANLQWPIEQLTDDRLLLVKDKLIIFDQHPISSFACSPEIYTVLAGAYKFDFQSVYGINYNFRSVNGLDDKLYFLVERLGIGIHVLSS